MSGATAIDLRLKNGKTWRIGTDDPEGLAQALNEARTIRLTSSCCVKGRKESHWFWLTTATK